MSGLIDANAFFAQNGHGEAAAKKFAAALKKAPPAQRGAQAANDLLRPTSPKPPALDDLALYGLAGEVTRHLVKGSEAHPAAVLTTLLACFGNAVGPGPHIEISADHHPAGPFVAVVGGTSVGRKGLSGNLVYRQMEYVDPNWYQDHVVGGLQSGEALVEAAQRATEDAPRAGQLLVKAAEFSQVLKIANRSGMVMSEVIREAFDGGTLALRRTSKPTVVAHGAHVSIVAHITPEELRDQLDHISMANGFANRFIYAHVERPRLVPRPKEPDFAATGDELKKVLGKARRRRDHIAWSRGADAWWEEMYPTISAERLGLVGALTARAEAKVLRLAVAYLLMDPDASRLEAEHLEAAYAVARYSEESVRNIFGDRTGSKVGDRILVELRAAFPGVISQSEVGDMLGGNYAGRDLENEIGKLVDLRLAERWKVPSGGRPRIDIRAMPW